MTNRPIGMPMVVTPSALIGVPRKPLANATRRMKPK